MSKRHLEVVWEILLLIPENSQEKGAGKAKKAGTDEADRAALSGLCTGTSMFQGRRMYP